MQTSASTSNGTNGRTQTHRGTTGQFSGNLNLQTIVELRRFESLDTTILNQNIISKKDESLISFAFKFTKSIIISFYYGIFFDKPKMRFITESHDISQLIGSKDQLILQIQTMCKLRGMFEMSPTLSLLIGLHFLIFFYYLQLTTYLISECTIFLPTCLKVLPICLRF